MLQQHELIKAISADPTSLENPDMNVGAGGQQEAVGRSRKLSNFSAYFPQNKLASNAEELQSEFSLNFDAESANPLSRRDKAFSIAEPYSRFVD